MANEIEVSFQLNYASTVAVGLKDFVQPDTFQYTQTTPGFHSQTQSVGTGTTTLDVLDLAVDAGVLVLQNLDSENSVSYGSSLLEFKIPAGKAAWLQISSTTTVVQIASSTGSVRVFSKLYET